jgi:lysozyme
VDGCRVLDISYWTGNVDWTKMSANADIIYLRATNGYAIKDSRYDEYVDGVMKTPMRWGSYHFYRNGQSPQQQAMWFLKHYREGTEPPVLDVEDIGTVHPDKLKIWLDIVEEGTGIKPAIYTSQGWWNSRFLSGVPWAKDYLLWVANWTTRPEPAIPRDWSDWWLWQYAAGVPGKTYGAYGSVDLNRLNTG